MFIYLWCFIFFYIVELINKSVIINKELMLFQGFYNELKPNRENKPNLSHYKVISSKYKILIPYEKQSKSYKLNPKTENSYLIAILDFNIFLVYKIGRAHV